MTFQYISPCFALLRIALHCFASFNLAADQRREDRPERIAFALRLVQNQVSAGLHRKPNALLTSQKLPGSFQKLLQLLFELTRSPAHPVREEAEAERGARPLFQPVFGLRKAAPSSESDAFRRLSLT